MKSLFRDHTLFASIFVTTCITFLYIIQKTDALASLRFFTHTTLLYTMWFSAVAFLAYRSILHRNISPIQTFFMGTAPSAIILCLTPFIFDSHIHWMITACTGFYFIVFGYFLIYTHHKKNYTRNFSHKKIPFPHIFFVIITVCIYLYFGINHLGQSFYVDEKLWVYDRIETYWDNLLDGDWYNTRPSDKPGVTTAVISGPGLLFFDPSNFDEGTRNKDQLEKMLFALRLPLFLTITFLILIAFFCAQKILSPTTSLLFLIPLCLSPLLLGIARMINPDAILWIFFLISFLCFMHYLFHNSLPALYCAGITIGLSLLTKYIANIFIIFYFFIILFDPIMRQKSYTHLVQDMRARLMHFCMMIFIAISVFYILYPGTWVKHDRILLATIHSEAFASTWIYFVVFGLLLFADVFWYRATITSAVITFFRTYRIFLARSLVVVFCIFILLTMFNVYTNMSLFDFMYIIESPKSVYRDVGALALFNASFYPLVFGITPIVLVGCIIGLYKTLRTKTLFTSHIIILYSIIFIFMYYAGSIINHVMPIVRYQIVLYPLMMLIASIGWTYVYNHTTKKRVFIIILCTAFILCETAQLYALHHFYFSYNSPILPQKYIINSKDMGDGNYEIAQYLNALPHAQDLLVWTDKTGLCQFFVGSCNNMIQDLSLVEIAPQIDYYVISQNRQGYIERLTTQKRDNRSDYPLLLNRLYNPQNPKVWELLPGGRAAQFIRIIASDAVNIIDQ